jgi:drug/metabolite transporter (DMT)-like permease
MLALNREGDQHQPPPAKDTDVLQQVYPLNLEQLSEEAGVTKEEILDGFYQDKKSKVKGRKLQTTASFKKRFGQSIRKLTGFLVDIKKTKKKTEKNAQPSHRIERAESPLLRISSTFITSSSAGSILKNDDKSGLRAASPLCSVNVVSTTSYDVEASKPTHPDEICNNAFLIQTERPSEYSMELPPKQLLLALPQAPCLEQTETLPSAVKEVTVEAAQVNGSLSVQLIVKKEVPVIGFVILITALCAVSSQGAVLNTLVGVPPLLKLFWRMSGASVVFFPLAAYKIYKKQRFPRTSMRVKLKFLLCVIGYTSMNSAFILSLSLTSIGHAYIFSNCHSIVMVTCKLLFGSTLVRPLEIFGAIVGFSGAALTTLDRSASISTAHPTSLEGDLIGFASACAACIYLFCAKTLRAKVGVRIFLFCLVTALWMMLLPIILTVYPEVEFSTHSEYGIFGWVNHLKVEAYIVVIGSFLGTMGFITSLKYFDPLVVSCTMLMQPIVATIIGIAIGMDSVPGMYTFFGGCSVILGCVLVLLGSRSSTTSIDVTPAFTAPSHVPIEEEDDLKSFTHTTYGSM